MIAAGTTTGVYPFPGKRQGLGASDGVIKSYCVLPAESGGTRAVELGRSGSLRRVGSYDARPKKRLCRRSLCCSATWVTVFLVSRIFLVSGKC